MRNLVDTANGAFANTQVPIRLSVFCIQELKIGESSTTLQRMSDIRNAMGSESNVMNGADIAVVVYSSTSWVCTTSILAHQNQCGLGERVHLAWNYTFALYIS